MLTNLNKTISISATSSVINAAGGTEIAAYMNATITPNGTVNITQSVQNPDLYRLYSDEVDADYDEFRADVKAEAGKIDGGETE